MATPVLGLGAIPISDTVTSANLEELVGGTATTLHSHTPAIGSAERTFTEAGAGTYTATVVIPTGATVTDVVWRNTVLWTAATSATLDVGDGDDPDGYISAVDVKAAPIADTSGAGGISTAASSTGTGAYKGGGGKYCSATKTITATVVSVGAGTAGRSRLLVTWNIQTATAAVKT